jgi:hypothetical protein
MIELYEPSAGLSAFYAMIARAAQGWSGAEPLRTLG